MNKIVSFILSLLLCAGVGGGAYALYKHYNPQDNPTIENPVENPDGGGNTDSGNSGGGNTDSGTQTPTETPLTAPANESTIVESRMEMQKGASLYLSGDDTTTGTLRFMVMVETSFLEEVQDDESKKIYMAVAPVRYFDEVNTENKTYMVWATAFAENESPVELVELTSFSALNDTHSYANFRLNGIPFGGMNMRIAAMAILADESGDTPIYKYSKMPDGETYRTNARSLAYVAGAALNAHALGETTYDEDSLAKLNSYVNMAVDYRNGLTESTDDNSKPMLTFTKGTSGTIKVGQTGTIYYEMTPAKVDMPVRFVSADTTIVTVDANGTVTGVKAGTTTIKVCVAGIISTVNVTVTA